MKKVYALAPKEDWIVDRFVKEWNADNSDIAVADPKQCDVVWLLADWAWDQISMGYLATKRVLTTIHHIVPQKFSARAQHDFRLRDQFTHAYHVPNRHTEAFIRPLTKVPIHVIPYWANQNIWRPTGTKEALRKKHGLPEAGFLVGSFQRDTEGNDLASPKLEKGPDLLADNLIKLYSAERRLHVVLAGWRRQYLIARLQAAGIPYTYVELPPQEVVNDLYQALDMYTISARQEGGPQALLECGLLGVPCISRDVGMASQVLPARSVNDDLWSARPSVPDVKSLRLPNGYKPYRNLIEAL